MKADMARELRNDMKKNTSMYILVFIVALLVVGGPFYFGRNKAASLDKGTKTYRTEEKGFKEKSKIGQKVRDKKEDWNKAKTYLEGGLPAEPDIQNAIRTLQTLAGAPPVAVDGATPVITDDVRWVQGSVTDVVLAKAPAKTVQTDENASGKKTTTTTVKSSVTTVAPTPTALTSTFDVTIAVEGGMGKVLAFVSRIQSKENPVSPLFVVSQATVTFGAANDAATTASTTSTTTPPVTNPGENPFEKKIVKATISLKVTMVTAAAPAAATPTTTVKK
jgi:hypothetical protein